LIVGLVVVGIGYLLVQRGITALKHVDLAPQPPIQSLKDDNRRAKEQISQAVRAAEHGRQHRPGFGCRGG